MSWGEGVAVVVLVLSLALVAAGAVLITAVSRGRVDDLLGRVGARTGRPGGTAPPPRHRPASRGVALHERPTVAPGQVVAVALLVLGLSTLPVALGYGLRGGAGVLLQVLPSAAAAVGGGVWLRALSRDRTG